MNGKLNFKGSTFSLMDPPSKVIEVIRTRKMNICQGRTRTWRKGLVYGVLGYPKASDLFSHQGLSFPLEERKVLDLTHESQAFLPIEQFLSPIFPCTAVQGDMEESCRYTGGI